MENKNLDSFYNLMQQQMKERKAKQQTNKKKKLKLKSYKRH